MIAYIDASVLMRIVLRQDDPLRQWGDLEHGVSSALLSVEAYRTLDQLWRRNQLTDSELTEKRGILTTFLPRLDLYPIDAAILNLASQSFPTPLRTFDAVHLATAVAYRAAQPHDERPLVFATHDRELARAAESMRFEVIGAPA
ncbi:MAG: PIN domain-containing protein [Thermoanaerobaculia bacterium]